MHNEFKETILFRIGERLKGYSLENRFTIEEYINIAKDEIKKNKSVFTNVLNDQDMMGYIFEDIQIVLENSIPSNKIIKIISSQDEFGRILYKEKKYKILDKNYENIDL